MIFEQGKVSALTIKLTNYDGTKSVEITGLVDTINIIEDIFKNTLYGSMEIIDGINLLSGAKSKNDIATFPILGEEFLEISYSISWHPEKLNVSLRFYVHSISQIEYAKNSTMKTYTLKFCSEENLLDSLTLVQKGYTGKHSDNVKSILNDYLFVEQENIGIAKKRAKKIFTQPTKGLQNVCIPRLPPLQAAQFLAKRSIAEDVFTSGSYVFFENFRGFYFCDIEFLISEGIKKAQGYDKAVEKGKKEEKTYLDNYTYYFENPTLTTKQDRNQKTIITMTHKSRFDTIEKLKYGMFQSDMIVYDYINKKIINTTFNFLNSGINEQGEKTNNSTLALGNAEEKSYPENSISFMKRVTGAGEYNKYFVIPKDLSIEDTYLDQIYANRASYFTRLSQNMFTIDTLGNPKVNAGDVIYINVPSGDGTDRNNSIDEFLTGYYLVCTISHKISRTTYVTTMDVYRNGYSKKIEATNEDKLTEVVSENNAQKRFDSAVESVDNALPADSQLGRIMKNFKDLLPPRR